MDIGEESTMSATTILPSKAKLQAAWAWSLVYNFIIIVNTLQY